MRLLRCLLVPTIPGIPEPQDVGTGSKYGSHAFSLPVSKPLFFQWQRLQEGAASRIYSYATHLPALANTSRPYHDILAQFYHSLGSGE